MDIIVTLAECSKQILYTKIPRHTPRHTNHGPLQKYLIYNISKVELLICAHKVMTVVFVRTLHNFGNPTI